MILIADSGASKSDWILIDQNREFLNFQLVGLNPYYLSTKETEDILSKELIPFIEAKRVEHLFFYGAGCSSVYKCMMLEEAFQKFFTHAEIQIESDLLASARALFGLNEGIACILGTGSNSCYFDGSKIAENIISLGYFFGDEGSGAHMGRLFIKDFLLNNLPESLSESFKNKYHYSRDNILDAVYNLPFPNRFLASFCKFFADNLSEKYIHELIENSFREFFINQVEKYEKFRKVPISFSGSVAYYFEPVLKAVAKEFDVKIEKILKTPINALAEFHSK
ncbi:MAG: ATPase [Bacteroidales bacterium]|nr:ATPase [Bacteroidales bacterium]MCF8404262.1 ATPase [Bacteroidales bacterium]